MNSRSKDTQSNKSKQNPDPLRVDIQSEIRLPVAITEYYAAQEHERIHSKCRERIKIIIESVAVLTAVALAVLTYQTLGEIKRQTGAAVDQLQMMKTSLETTERAYVNVQNVELLAFEVGKRPEALVSYKNSGQTPANHTLVVPDSVMFERPSVGPYRSPPDIMKDYLSCERERGPGPILPPGVTRTVNTLRMAVNKGPLEPLTSKTLTDMRQMRTTWFVVAYTAYFDAFGACHRIVEPFEFDPFTKTFNPSSMNAIPDQSDNRHTKNQPQP